MSQYVQITSTKNPIVQRFRSAAGGDDPEAMVADGVGLVADALAAGCELVEVATSPRLVAGSGAGRELRRNLLSSGVSAQDCSDDVMQRISHLTTHQGVAAIVRRPVCRPREMFGSGALVLVAAGVRDPGNLGSVMRSAEAAGASGLVAVTGGAHPFRDKAVRGSAGSVFRLPVWADATPEELLALLGESGVQCVAADARGERAYTDVDFGLPTAIFVGNEGEGVPTWLAGDAAERVRIPVRSPVESLNVAVAAGVLLFEARRQRT